LFNTVKDYDVAFKYANGVEMTCKPGNRVSSSLEAAVGSEMRDGAAK
jgi:hypothetical protein